MLTLASRASFNSSRRRIIDRELSTLKVEPPSSDKTAQASSRRSGISTLKVEPAVRIITEIGHPPCVQGVGSRIILRQFDIVNALCARHRF